jgi:hypothetical protein
MDNKIMEELEAAFGQELALVKDDLGALERTVQSKLRQLGRGLLQRLLDRQPHGYQGSSIPCSCGSSKRFVTHRAKGIHTLFGWLELRRAYYHCSSCKRIEVPYDRTMGLGDQQLSPGLARACCLLAVDDSFEQSSRKAAELLGQDVSANSIERLVHQVGQTILNEQDRNLEEFFAQREFPEAQTKPERLYVAVDGTTVHEKDGWHEAKMAAIYWENDCQEGMSRFVGRFSNSESFGWHVWLEACRCGLRQAPEVVFLGDGAAWIRHERRRHFGRATFIIDWYHASEHLWDCGKVLFGEGRQRTKRWVRLRQGWLWDGYTKKLIDDLAGQIKVYRGGKRKALIQVHKYIKDNEEEMRYDVFRNQGYDIGSGAVEGSCKHVVGKRLKQSGMIWSRLGSSATLALRITWLNREWDRLWSRKPLAA